MKAKIFLLTAMTCAFFLASSGIDFSQNSFAEGLKAGDIFLLAQNSDLQGFDEAGNFEDDEQLFNSVIENRDQIDEVKTKKQSLYGFVKNEFAYSYLSPDSSYGFYRDKKELSKIKNSLNLTLDITLPKKWKLKISGNAFYDFYYYMAGRNNFSDKTLDNFEKEIELRETFFEGPLLASLPSLWFKTGRQIIAWGESEGAPILDMVNPRDNREFGQVDIEDRRIPLFASKLSYIVSEWELNVVASHEFRANKTGADRTDYDPYITLRDKFSFSNDELPNQNLDNTEMFYRLSKSFNGGDIRFIYGDLYDKESYLDFDITTYNMTPKHKRFQMYGITGDMVLKSWLFKIELAKKNGIAGGRRDLLQQIFEKSKVVKSWTGIDKTEVLMGVDYTGIEDLYVSLEVGGTTIDNHKGFLIEDKTSLFYTLIIKEEMWNQTLTPQVIWLHLPNNNGEIGRFDLDYKYSDGIEISSGIILYYTTDKNDFLYPYRQNDRIYTGIKHSF